MTDQRELHMAVGSLLDAAEHVAKAGKGQGCDSPVGDPDNWDGGVRECGACWPCVLKILGQRAAEVRAAYDEGSTDARPEDIYRAALVRIGTSFYDPAKTDAAEIAREALAQSVPVETAE